jgi:hypothetical protein
MRRLQTNKLVTACGAVVLSLCAITQAEMFYAVDDVGSKDSRLVRVVKTDTDLVIENIGSTYDDLDIEGIDFHPTTGLLYAVGGENGVRDDKKLYTWDISDGSLTELGTIGGASNPLEKRDIVAASFNPLDSSYWISVEDSGLYTLDIDTLGVTKISDDKIFTKGSGVEGLTWTQDGSTLLAGDGKYLYSVDVSDGSVEKLSGKLTHDIEGLFYDSEGNLLATKSGDITKILLSGKEFTSEAYGKVSGRDLESGASVIPEPTTLTVLGLGGLAVLLRRRRR